MINPSTQAVTSNLLWQEICFSTLQCHHWAHFFHYYWPFITYALPHVSAPWSHHQWSCIYVHTTSRLAVQRIITWFTDKTEEMVNVPGKLDYQPMLFQDEWHWVLIEGTSNCSSSIMYQLPILFHNIVVIVSNTETTVTKMNDFNKSLFWVVTQYGLVGRYQHFRQIYCLHLQNVTT
jgi:hypothetical protein